MQSLAARASLIAHADTDISYLDVDVRTSCCVKLRLHCVQLALCVCVPFVRLNSLFRAGCDVGLLAVWSRADVLEV